MPADPSTPADGRPASRRRRFATRWTCLAAAMLLLAGVLLLVALGATIAAVEALPDYSATRRVQSDSIVVPAVTPEAP